MIYLKKPSLSEPFSHSALNKFFEKGWGFDKLYDTLFVRPIVWLSVIDKKDFFDLWSLGLSRLASLFQHSAQHYSKWKNEMVSVVIRNWYYSNFNLYARKMILIYLIVILLAGAFLAWITGKHYPVWSRIISLAVLSVDLAIILLVALDNQAVDKDWIADIKLDWIPAFGISLHFALDGLSLVMLILTFFLGIISVIISWKEINTRVGFFHFNLLLILAGITGVFLSLDLFLFYFFWELMLVPMYFLIGIWGHENRTAASNKFFLYTQASGLADVHRDNLIIFYPWKFNRSIYI